MDWDKDGSGFIEVTISIEPVVTNWVRHGPRIPCPDPGYGVLVAEPASPTSSL